jgi:hypothetical protein
MPTCNRCRSAPRAENSHLCPECRQLCAKCQENPRAPGQSYCSGCWNAYKKRWRKTDGWLSSGARKRNNARSYANVYLQRGKIQKGPCEIEGCPEPPLMHHSDYSKPLEIRWLCRQHRPSD